MPLVIYTSTFLFIALAAKRIGEWFSKIGLPYITGYLLAGMVAGPFILNLLPENSTTTLRYIDQIALGIIAFVAGSELYLKEIRSQLRSISWITGGVMLFALPLIGAALFMLTEFIPFTQGMPVVNRAAVAILGGTILLALSPASTIAVIKEVRAKGQFTRTILGVTVTMDVVIIVLFAVSVAVASALLTGMGFSASFAGLLLLDLGAALLLGLATGQVLNSILSLGVDQRIKIGLVLLAGYAIFVFGYWIIGYSHDNLPVEIHIEPLLVAMIAGFYVTNYTPHREQFADLLHDVGPLVYVAFFTLTGVAIKLDILLQTWPVAIALFVVRGGSIFLGSYAGSRAVGESASFQRNAWLGLITQAGIALGLAREVAVEFPTLGDAFATMVISVVVLNEVFGPLMLKWALRRTGEASLPESATVDEVRHALIFGIEAQSRELARKLAEHNWWVQLVDTDPSHVNGAAGARIEERVISAVDEGAVGKVFSNGRLDAVVAMLEDDVANLRACEIAYHHNIPRLVVRPNEIARATEFAELNALVIDPASAMVNLLDQSVRAPQTAAMLLHQDSGRELIQVTVSNQEVDGRLVRDLRLPGDVLFLDVTRNGQSVVPNGYTRLRLHDEVTLIGRVDSLEEATLKLGY